MKIVSDPQLRFANREEVKQKKSWICVGCIAWVPALILQSSGVKELQMKVLRVKCYRIKHPPNYPRRSAAIRVCVRRFGQRQNGYFPPPSLKALGNDVEWKGVYGGITLIFYFCSHSQGLFLQLLFSVPLSLCFYDGIISPPPSCYCWGRSRIINLRIMPMQRLFSSSFFC